MAAAVRSQRVAVAQDHSIRSTVIIARKAVTIEEGRNAGLWTVAVAVSGNEVGLSLDEWSALGAQQQAFLRDRAYKSLQKSRPDYVIDTIAKRVRRTTLSRNHRA
jgi:phosphonoacetaldehyde hydrolase